MDSSWRICCRSRRCGRSRPRYGLSSERIDAEVDADAPRRLAVRFRCSFPLDQGSLPSYPPSISPEVPVCSHDPVAWDHDRRRVGGACPRHCPRGARAPDGAGDLSVRARAPVGRSEEHTSELQSQSNLVCRLLLEKKKKYTNTKLATSS